jgi:hypothetical protein
LITANSGEGVLRGTDDNADDSPCERPTATPDRASEILSLSQRLGGEGRIDDALFLAEYLSALQPSNAEVLRHLVRLLGAKGRMLEALERLARLKYLNVDLDILLSDIVEQLPAVAKQYQQCLSAGELERAEPYAAALAALAPGHAPFVAEALSCNRALGRDDETARYANMMLALEPSNLVAQGALAEFSLPRGSFAGEAEHRFALAMTCDPWRNPLLRLQYAHEAASLILGQETLTGESIEKVEALREMAANLPAGVEANSEMRAFEKYFRLTLEALDLSSLAEPALEATGRSPVSFASSAGALMALADVQALSSQIQPEAVFFAAADATYVARYARLYARSVLRHAGISCLVLIHVIGGRRTLQDIARSTGVEDPQLIFCGDDFEASAVATRCYDAPPRGLIGFPAAHYQSARFQRLAELLDSLKLPIFVSDIDCIMQRGIRELLDRTRDADIALNWNAESPVSSSQVTANLLHVKPTTPGMEFARFLGQFLDRALSLPEVTRWIDQIGLLIAFHHLRTFMTTARIAFFDTHRDINNIMYNSYEETPFCFLSLYQDFDLGSLDRDSW